MGCSWLLNAYIGIQTRLVLGPLLLRFGVHRYNFCYSPVEKSKQATVARFFKIELISRFSWSLVLLTSPQTMTLVVLCSRLAKCKDIPIPCAYVVFQTTQKCPTSDHKK